jgi:hypothetical protein
MAAAVLSAGTETDRATNGDSEKGSRQEKIAAAVLLVMLGLLQIRTALLRPLWFDELFTYLVSSQPTWGAMFRAIPLDGNPPLYFILGRLCLHLPIRAELALRIPSLLAFDLAVILVYVFVRRNANSVVALLAASVLVGSGTGLIDSVQARPYALLLCFAAATICCWQCAVRGQRRKWALAGIAGATAGAILSHNYGVVHACLPVFAGEAVRWRLRRKLDVPVVVASLTGAAAILITFPGMLHGQHEVLNAIKNDGVFWFRPRWHSFLSWESMLPMLQPGALVIFGIPALIAGVVIEGFFWKGERRRTEQERLRREDFAVGAMLVMLVPVMIAATEMSTRYFVGRYAVSAALGCAIVLGMGIAQLSGRVGQKGAVLIFSGIVYSLLLASVSLWVTGKSGGLDTGLEPDALFRSIPSHEEIVMDDAMQYFPTWWYGDEALRRRLHYLADLNFAVKQPDFLPEYSLEYEAALGTPKMDPYREFLASHREFVLYSFGVARREWLKERLKQDGWTLTPIGSEEWTHDDTEGRTEAHMLYRVTAPDWSPTQAMMPALDAGPVR